MTVHVLGNKSEFVEKVQNDKSGRLVVIDCFATWCGPCKMIAPVIAKFSNEHTEVDFYKIDVDEVSDVAQELGIRAMPTFVFFKNGEKVTEVVGANSNAILAAISAEK